MVPLVSLATFIQPKTAVAPGTILDNISLSAAAQKYISTAGSAFPVRPESLTRLASGNLTMLGAGDYSGAAFIGQNLQNAIFENALLTNANFSSANLQGSQFIASVVTGANFAQSDLRGADLRGAQGLMFSQVQSATFDNTTQFPSTIGANIFGTFGASGGK
ncbi:MAG: pentapeptide repeat-containing protein [Rhodospirillaceae bacterium]|nr:MAG: pentapeptide repeat-containing protein [Rhodospirillaceae bacterium]